MSGLAVKIVDRVRDALDAAGRELRALEADLGLCADCGERPPAPLSRRAMRPMPAPAPVVARPRRVA